MKNLYNAVVLLLGVILLNSCSLIEPKPGNYPPAKTFPGGRLSAIKTGDIDKYNSVQRYVYQGNRLTQINGYYVERAFLKSPKENLDYSADLVYNSSGQLIEVKYNYKGWDFSRGYSIRTSRYVMAYGVNNKLQALTTYSTDGSQEFTKDKDSNVLVFTYNATQQLVQEDTYGYEVEKKSRGLLMTITMKYDLAGNLVQSLRYNRNKLTETIQYEYGESYNFFNNLPVPSMPILIYSNIDGPTFKKNVIRTGAIKILYEYDVKGRVVKKKLVTEDERQTYGFTQYEYEG
jgi:hypothetical protein